jgi:hypothetical protein
MARYWIVNRDLATDVATEVVNRPLRAEDSPSQQRTLKRR